MSSSSQQMRKFDHENPYSASHWSQRKVKSFRLQQLPTGQLSVLCAPRVPSARLRRHSFDIQQMRKAQLQQPTAAGGDHTLSQQINYFLPPVRLSRNLSTPGNLPRPVSASNERARQGFKFWIDDKSKSSSGNKVTLGARGSFLGVGVPRL